MLSITVRKKPVGKDKYIKTLESIIALYNEQDSITSSLSDAYTLLKSQNKMLIESNAKLVKELNEKTCVIRNVSSGKWHLPKDKIEFEKAVNLAKHTRKVYQETQDMIKYYDEITGLIYCSEFKEKLANSYGKRIEEERIALSYGFIVENQLTSNELDQKYRKIQIFLDNKNVEMGK